MTDREDPERTKREADAAHVKEKEGFGAVPNVAAGQAVGKEGELKEAVHQFEEEKGDWSKGH